MTTQGAIVLPVAIRGMIEESAMRRPSMPYNLKLVVDHRHAIAAHLGCAGLVPIGDGRFPDEVDHP